ncbi:hypothetical protein PENTCL1PPCAC_3141 [Pristionchus entomophagus]|uniref:Ribosomal protein n=1 Tax=Pristionchus entomophagus TaxID=358040 RepID=A0AAV5SC95_9BILA|nr:hypothetical protein PENTCL1PPCAC_3141 [Pristionchus entomophagus]
MVGGDVHGGTRDTISEGTKRGHTDERRRGFDRLGRAHVARLVGAGLGHAWGVVAGCARAEAATRSSRRATAARSPGVLLTSVAGSSASGSAAWRSHVGGLVHVDE